jgi:hypothetical protein
VQNLKRRKEKHLLLDVQVWKTKKKKQTALFKNGHRNFLKEYLKTANRVMKMLRITNYKEMQRKPQ